MFLPPAWIRQTPCALLLLSMVGGCGDHPTGIRFVGLDNGACEAGGRPLFGRVPVRLLPEGSGTFAKVRLSVNEGAPAEDEDPPFQIEVDTTTQPDGTVRLQAEGVDASGHTVSATIEVCVDNGPPALNLISPDEGASVYLEDAALTARVRATDAVRLSVVAARIEAGGRDQKHECVPPDGPDSVCTLEPAALGLALAPAASEALTLTVIARDATGHEAQIQRQLTLRTRLLWDFDPQASAISWSAAPLAGGNVAVGTDAGRIIVVSAAGGEVARWTANADPITTPLTPSQDQSRLFFGTNKNLYCLNAADLSPCWATPPAGVFLASQPLHHAQKNVVFVGRYGEAATPGVLAAYNAGNGALVGTFPVTQAVNESVTAPPAVSADGGTVYIGSVEGQLYAVNVDSPASMALRWTYDTTAKVDTLPLVTGGRIYVAGFDGYLHAVDPATGGAAGGFSFMREYPFASNVIASPEGTLYAANMDEWLYALDGTGGEAGSYRIGRTMYTSPAIGPGGIIYAACTIGPGPDYGPGRLYALTPLLDRLLWYFEPAASVEFRASPVIVANGGSSLVVIGNTNGHLYALDATPPAS